MARLEVSPGVQPLLAQAPWVSGRYYFVPNYTATGTAAGLGNGSLRALPFYVPNAVTLARIGGEVTVIGDAGCTIRLGIYADNGNGRPGTLVIDAGTIAGDSVAVQEIVISQALGAGIFWAAGVIQGVTVTQPTVRTNSPGPIIGVDSGTVIPAAGGFAGGFSVAGVTAALPASFGAPTSLGSSVPRIFVRVA